MQGLSVDGFEASFLGGVPDLGSLVGRLLGVVRGDIRCWVGCLTGVQDETAGAGELVR